MLRVAQVLPFDACEDDLFDYLDSLPPASQYLGFEAPAPILVLSDVFEPDLCASLIRHFDQIGGNKSRFMQELNGKPVEVVDPEWKRRRDHMINDLSLIGELRRRIARRVAPEMQKAFHFKTTRTERDLIGCYRAEDQDHFGAHRDDVTAATAHRQFAVSINLNDDFEGGETCFPEFGARRYKGPAGAAMIFSCSMLHDVSKVTKGRRYAYLTFLYDEAGEQTRLAASGKSSERTGSMHGFTFILGKGHAAVRKKVFGLKTRLDFRHARLNLTLDVVERLGAIVAFAERPDLQRQRDDQRLLHVEGRFGRLPRGGPCMALCAEISA